MSDNIKKHILIITYNDYPVYEGLGVRIRNISKVLQLEGFDVTIFAPNIDHARPVTEIVDGIRVIRIGLYIPSFLKKNRIVARSLLMVLHTIASPFIYFSRLRKFQFHTIIAEHIYAVPVACVLKFFTKKKILVDDIINVSEIMKEGGHHNLAKWFTKIEKLLFRYCDDFIYTSEISHRYYSERGAVPGIFLPNGVDTTVFKPLSKRNDKFTIFFNGSTFSGQNVAAIVNFLDIAQFIHTTTSADILFRLSCWPLYNLDEHLQNRIQKAGSWLEFTEGIEQIHKAIAEADLAILPYSKDHLLTGGTRLKAMEYLSCGTIVLSTPEGVMGITGLKDGHHYMLAKNISELAELVLYSYSNQQSIRKIGKNGRKFVIEQYDWKATTRVLISNLTCKYHQNCR